MFGSYGIDQCLDLVESGAEERTRTAQARGEDWLEGTGIALAMLESGPPTEHRSGAEMRLWPTAAIIWLSARPRWAMARSPRIARSRLSVLGTRASSIAIVNGDTDATPYDTGTFASTGTVVAGQAVEKAARALRDKLLEFASRTLAAPPANAVLQDDAIICGNRQIPLTELYAEGAKAGRSFRREPQGLSLAALGRVQRAWRPARRASRHRRDRDPAECACRRHRQTDQSDAVPRPDRGRDRHGFRLDALREDGVRRERRDGEPGACATIAFLLLPTCRGARSISPTPTTRSVRSARKRKANARSIPSRPRLPMRVANATGIRFPDLPLTPDRIFDKLRS